MGIDTYWHLQQRGKKPFHQDFGESDAFHHQLKDTSLLLIRCILVFIAGAKNVSDPASVFPANSYCFHLSIVDDLPH
jgi:hypothetical protein